MDLCLRYAGETLAIEIKVWSPGRPDPQAAGSRSHGIETRARSAPCGSLGGPGI